MKLLGPALGIVSLLREISVEDIRRATELDFAIGVIGPSAEDCELLVDLLTGIHRESPVRNRAFRVLAWPISDDQPASVRSLSLIIYVAKADQEIPETAMEVLRDAARGLTPLIVVMHTLSTARELTVRDSAPSGVFRKTVVLSRLDCEQVAEYVVPAILDQLPEHTIALGRSFAPLRQAAAAKAIIDTSWANAQFSAFSNLPALIPVVGNIIAATADFFVLTRNQIMLLLKLAAVYGRDLREVRSIYLELLPVVGAAFLWRTVARELVALLPGLLGAVPKVLIAFAGTYVVGQSAAYYYDQGRKPPAEVIRSFYSRSSEKASEVVPGILSNARSLLSKVNSNGDADEM